MRYRFSNPASQDIIDIYLRSEEMFGEAQADRYLERENGWSSSAR